MSKAIPFERSLSELESVVTQLEKGELSLEDALKQFEKGIVLARKCQETLKFAEQKITFLQSEQQTQTIIDEDDAPLSN